MSNKYSLNNKLANSGAASRTLFAMALTVALLVITGGFGDQAKGQVLSSRHALNRLAQGGNDAPAVMFRGGRDLISDQQWLKAEEKFRQYVASFPNEKNVDAALYWLAYSEYQLAKFDQCRKTIDQLLKDYQKSSWKEDARTLLAQIPEGEGEGDGTGSGTGTGVGTAKGTASAGAVKAAGVYTRKVAPRAIFQGQFPQTPQTPQPARPVMAPRFELAEAPSFDFDFNFNDDGFGGRGADDDPCEFKIVVLQALFQSDVQRGISAATEWLAASSTQTVRCKGAALTLLARHGGKGVTPVILSIAKNEPDQKLRARAIAALGTTSDDTVIDPLRDFALNSQDSTIVDAALYALGQHTGPRAVPVLAEIAMSSKPASVRRTAISSIANRKGEPSVDALLKIYDADQTLEIRKAVIGGFGHRISERAGNKLLEIARGSDNIELRKAAISAIASRGGDKAIDNLLNLYDSEKSEELKDRIINALGSSNDPRVIQKLISIARDAQAPIDRRKRAINMLSRSKDPAVAKFLEELLNNLR